MTTKDVRDVLHYNDQTPLWLVQGEYTWGKSLTLIGAINNAELEDCDACVVMRVDNNAYVAESSELFYDHRSDVYRGLVNEAAETVTVTDKLADAA